MSLSLRLDLRQSQSLVMTPQLQQAIKLLQLSNLELTAYVEGELEQNPLLERQEEPDPTGPADEADRRARAPRPSRAPARSSTAASSMSAGGEPGDGWSGAADEGWAGPAPALDGLAINAVASNGMAPIGRGGSADFSDPGPDLEARLSRPKTLREHLIEQLQLDLPPGAERLIGLHLIDLVDEAGYLREDLDEVALRLGCPAGAGRRGARPAAAVRPARRVRPLAARNAWRCSCAIATASTRRWPPCSIIWTCWRRPTSRP